MIDNFDIESDEFHRYIVVQYVYLLCINVWIFVNFETWLKFIHAQKLNTRQCSLHLCILCLMLPCMLWHIRCLRFQNLKIVFDQKPLCYCCLLPLLSILLVGFCVSSDLALLHPFYKISFANLFSICQLLSLIKFVFIHADICRTKYKILFI